MKLSPAKSERGQALLTNEAGQALLTNESGQALLIVLLSMAVVLTVVLSVISFSVTDIAVTNRESEALRAFSAAEAGVEKALIAVSPQSGSFGGDNFSAKVSGISEGEKTFNYPTDLASGDEAAVWFVAHDANGNPSCSVAGKPCFTGSQMYVCWAKPGTSGNSANTPAVEVSVYYSNPPSVAGDYSGVSIARATFDPNAGRRGQNSFSATDALATCTIDGKDYAFRGTVDFAALGIPAASFNAQNGLQLAHVRLFYNTDISQPVGFDVTPSGAGLLPSQGEQVESTGTAGESTRKVEVFKLYSNIASAFESAIFSPSGVTK